MKNTSIKNNNRKSSNLAGGTPALPGKAPIQPVEAAMAGRRRVQAELRGLRELLASNSARLAELETTGDIKDAGVITEIGRLQVLAGLLPRRIAARDAEDAKAEEALTQAVN